MQQQVLERSSSMTENFIPSEYQILLYGQVTHMSLYLHRP